MLIITVVGYGDVGEDQKRAIDNVEQSPNRPVIFPIGDWNDASRLRKESHDARLHDGLFTLNEDDSPGAAVSETVGGG